MATFSSFDATKLPLVGGTLRGHLYFTDATYDLGATATGRPKDIFASGVVTGATINATTKFTINGAALSANKVLAVNGAATASVYKTLVAGANVSIAHDDTTITIGSTGAGSATAAGADKEVQFNDGGLALGADSDFTWNKTTNILTLTGGTVRAGDGSATAPSYSFGSDTNTGFYRTDPDVIYGTTGGTASLSISVSGLQISSAGAFAFSSAGVGASSDTILLRDAANILAQRNGANRQEFKVYDTYTDASNKRYITVGYGGIGQVGTGTGASGSAFIVGNLTGMTGPIQFYVNNTSRWSISSSGHFLAATDNTYDIGASGANRPRYAFISSAIIVGAGASVVRAATDGILTLLNAAETGFNRLQLGGTSEDFPALKRSGASIHFVNGDDTSLQDIRVNRLEMADQAGAPATPAAGLGILYGMNDGKVYWKNYNGIAYDLTLGSGGTPGGLDTQVQFNDSGVFGGDSSFVWNKTTNVLTVGNDLVFGTFGKIQAASDGVLTLLDNAGTSFTRVNFGGASASFPAIKQVSGGIQIRLADDANYAPLIASHLTVGLAGNFTWLTRSLMSSSADGNIELFNNSSTGFNLLRFGGTSSLFPALKRSSATLQSRLADDTGYADFAAANITASASSRITFDTRTRITSPTDGNLLLTNNLVTGFGLMQFGGTTSAFPAMKPYTNRVDFRLADDSDYAYVATRLVLANGLSGSGNQILGNSASGSVNEYKTVTAGTGISITHAANSITIANTQVAGNALKFSQTATLTHTNTAAEVSLLGTGAGSKTLAANAFVAGTILRVRVFGQLDRGTRTPTLIVKVKLGSVVIATINGPPMLLDHSAATLPFALSSDLVCRTTGSGGTFVGDVTFVVGAHDVTNNSGSHQEYHETDGFTQSTVNTTATQVVDATIQWGTAYAEFSTKSVFATVELITPA